MPLPLRFTKLVLPVLELLENVREPEAAPVVVGSNVTWIVIAMVGFSVTGNVAPEKEKPVPVKLAALTVTGAVPVEVRVTGSVTGVPTASFPKLMVVVLRVRVGLVPVPLKFTVVVVLPVDELEMTTVPVAAPAAVGLKLT